MKLHHILSESASVGSTGASAIAVSVGKLSNPSGSHTSMIRRMMQSMPMLKLVDSPTVPIKRTKKSKDSE